VDVAKLSLYLKLLQDETPGSAREHQLEFHEALLPSLNRNIVCGNSLIGTDILDGQLFEGGVERKLNPMNYEDAFPRIFRRSRDGQPQSPEGGFDAVIGNPPYVQIENIPARDREYFIRRYGENDTLGKRYDIYQVFLLRAIPLLAKNGKLGFILPNTFLVGHSYDLLRKRICENTKIREVVDLPQGVFEGVTVDNVLLFVDRESNAQARQGNGISINKLNAKSDKSRVATRDWDESFIFKQADVEKVAGNELRIYGNPILNQLFSKLEDGNIRLGDITDSGQGIILYETAKQAEESEHTGFKKQSGWKKLLRGKDIGRYELHWKGEYVHYGRWLWRAREERFFNRPKILLHAMRNKSLKRRLVGTFDPDVHYNAHNLANIILKENSLYDLRFVLGLFNSQLVNFWYKGHFPNVNINPSDFRQIPVPKIDFTKSADKIRHDRMVQLVEQMLEAKKQLAAAQTEKDRTYFENKSASLDRQIDALVYDLYGLTEEEIKIVEGTATS
jgi:hypothetical protein